MSCPDSDSRTHLTSPTILWYNVCDMKKLPTRKKIIAALNELVSSSRAAPVFEVDVHSQKNPLEEFSALMKVFRGGSAKEDLLAFLMDKSLTHRIFFMRDWRCRNIEPHPLVMEVHIYLLGSDEKFLEYTNIDSEVLEMLGKVRFVDEDI